MGGRWVRILVCASVLAAAGCVGAVDRADFEERMRARGGGLVSALPLGAISALSQRLGVPEVQATVLVLTAPDSANFRVVLADQPPQVTAFLAEHDLTSREAAVWLRVRTDRRLDDYAYLYGTLGPGDPVRVSAREDLDADSFTLNTVAGLSRIEEIVDTALARSELDGAHVPVIVVARFDGDIRIVANVVSSRAEIIAEFDETGQFTRIRPV
ncbi:hypothetical protein ABZ319_38405 [Nocardia sp. NPDC005978]|uniref:hypothetical protein n=1 Tax=Nocardia sp. NPDC005978 TaxID=3156725 RepID=UPI0033BB8361